MVLTVWPISFIKTLQPLHKELRHDPWRILKLELDTAALSHSSVILLQILKITEITQFVTDNVKTVKLKN